MTSLLILSWLVGAVLAQRFKVRILLPATAIVVVAAAATGLIQSDTVGWTILMVAAAGASLQIGYMFGLGVRYLLEARSTESPRIPAARSRPAQTTPLT